MFRRLIFAVAGLLVVAFAVLAITLQYTAECPSPPAMVAGGERMMAVRRYCYGPPEVLVYGEVAKPVPEGDQILVQVAAAAVNHTEAHFLRGSPYVLRLSTGIGTPEETRVGRDFAGTVVAVGDEVERFRVGDRVFGSATGAYAEYLVRSENGSVTRIPENVGFDQAAGTPIAGVTALQALRDHGLLQPGQRVLINGASGGVGSFAVQIAKAMGAHVTGVCSGRNADMVRALGADEVIDYQQANYLEGTQRYDLVVDMVGNHSPLQNRKVLNPDGRLVIVGGKKGNWIAPFVGMIQAAVSNAFVDQELVTFVARMRPDDLKVLGGMLADGSLRTEIDREMPLSEAGPALQHLESHRAQGKILLVP